MTQSKKENYAETSNFIIGKVLNLSYVLKIKIIYDIIKLNRLTINIS